MRVIAGLYGGRILKTPAAPGKARPTSGLVRGAIFNSLDARGHLQDAIVVDLFAGSGALGIEALSRGAQNATFVESDRGAAAVITANLDALGITAATVVPMTVERWAGRRHPPVDLVLADPPYNWEDWDQLLPALVPFTKIAVVEASHQVTHPDWDIAAVHHHGGTVVTQLQPKAPPHNQKPL